MSIMKDSSISNIKGIGTKKQSLLKKLNIVTVSDLIHFFPRSYEDLTKVKNLSEIEQEEKVLIKCIITGKKQNRWSKNRNLMIKAEDETGVISIIFFNVGGFLSRLLNLGQEYLFFGQISKKGNQLTMLHPEIIKEEDYKQGLNPIYPLTEGITNKDIRKWIGQIINEESLQEDIMPKTIKEKYDLLDLKQALKYIHFPKSKEEVKKAQYTLKFHELFRLSWKLKLIKENLKENQNGDSFNKDIDINDFFKELRFEPTDAQKKAISEMRNDLISNKVMNRLLQGDVGSGKTLVAESLMFLAYKSGYQSVMMAPTEILAMQHYESVKRDFKNIDAKIAFLSSSTKKTEKNKILNDIANGKTDIVVGTHSLIQEDVKFNNLNLVITDEQHKFGVNQRRFLSSKGNYPHSLVMTATPVPRSLAAIFYGGFDISIIDKLPQGRIPIETYSASYNSARANKIYDFIAKEIQNNKQAYVVAPTIRPSENLENVQSVEEIYENIKKKINIDEIEILHGEQKEDEKKDKINRFKNGEIKVIVSTVLIEVGVDVPQATIMLIQNAERFGLAQLHQLRGRVGRGKEKSYCFLIYNNPTEVGLQRIETMCKTTDGFLIAEKDLELRGTGEMFGTRQHGENELRISSLIKDKEILELTRNVVDKIFENLHKISKEEKDLLNIEFNENADETFNI